MNLFSLQVERMKMETPTLTKDIAFEALRNFFREKAFLFLVQECRALWIGVSEWALSRMPLLLVWTAES